MIKRTLYFGNPAYLSCKLEQLVVRLPEVEKNNTQPDQFKKNKALRRIAGELIQVPVKLESNIKVSENHIGQIVSVGEYYFPSGSI